MSRIPSDELYNHVPDKYTGVIITAKRAREIMKSADKDLISKPLLKAYDELMSGDLKFIHELPKDEPGEMQ